MEVFSEIYSTYYTAVRHVLAEAMLRPIAAEDIQRILLQHSFSESAYHMLPKLQHGDWPLLREESGGYVTPCILPKEQPLSTLQLSWLKSILEDPRIHLFLDSDDWTRLNEALKDIPLLFGQDDFHVFDKAQDGDPYSDKSYQDHFKVFLTAIHQSSPLFVKYEGGKGHRVSGIFRPYRLEYSSKDDKFRVLCYKETRTQRISYVLNMGRIVFAVPHDKKSPETPFIPTITRRNHFREFTMEITHERNALERCMVQFAHFEKRTEYDDATNKYTCTIKYNSMDETELVIRVLSFGPTVKVLGPKLFLDQIKSRIKKQTKLIGENTWGSQATNEVGT